MFFLGVIGIVGAFDSDVLAGYIDVLPGDHVAGADADIFAGFDIDVAVDAADSTAYLLSVLVGILVFLLFFADGEAQTAAAEQAGFFDLFYIFAGTGLFGAGHVQVAAGFDADVVIGNYAAAFDVGIGSAVDDNAAAADGTADDSVQIAVVVDVGGFAAENAADLGMRFLQAFVVFCRIGDIDIAAGVKLDLAFFAGKAAALQVDVAAAADGDIFRAGDEAAFYGFIDLAGVVIIVAAAAAHAAFFAVQVFNGCDIDVAAGFDSCIFSCCDNAAFDVDVAAGRKADIFTCQGALLVFDAVDLGCRTAVGHCYVFFVGDCGDIDVLSRTECQVVICRQNAAFVSDIACRFQTQVIARSDAGSFTCGRLLQFFIGGILGCGLIDNIVGLQSGVVLRSDAAALIGDLVGRRDRDIVAGQTAAQVADILAVQI